jgi:hypothetical protein
MAYIGKTPTVGNFQVCDAISVVNNQAAYTMQVGSVNVSPESANHMIVSLNGVIQKPTDAFTVSGSTITFASNLVTGDVINFIQILGNVLDLGVPSDDTVTAAKLGANSVTAAKLNNDIISGTTALATAPADTDEFLVSDAGTLKRIDYSLIKGGIANAQQWRITSAFTVGTSVTDVDSNWEISDATGYATIGTALTESSGIFSFPTTGIWLIMAYANFRGNAGSRGVGWNLKATTNNSSYGFVSSAEVSNSDFGGANNTTYHAGAIMGMFDVTDTAQVKFRFTTQATGDTQTCDGDTTRNYTGFTAIRLGDT